MLNYFMLSIICSYDNFCHFVDLVPEIIHLYSTCRVASTESHLTMQYFNLKLIEHYYYI